MLAIFVFGFCESSHATLKVVASTSDLAWLVRAVGKNKVSVTALSDSQDCLHYIDDKKIDAQALRNADAIFSVGLELEIGWLPFLISLSKNSKIFPGGRGYAETARWTSIMERPEKPTSHLLKEGNPFFWLAPRRMIEASLGVSKFLSGLDPKNAQIYEIEQQALAKRLARHFFNRRQKLRRLKVAQYQKEFSYFIDDYGLTSWGSIEEVPGVPPSTGHLDDLAHKAKSDGVQVLLVAPYSPRRFIERFQRLTGASVIVLGTSLSGGEEYDEWQDKLVEKLRDGSLKPDQKTSPARLARGPVNLGKLSQR